MSKVLVQHLDVFSAVAGKGNPAGVVLEGDLYTEKQMQTIAAKVGFNETAFVVPSNHADVWIRFFTPGHEINLCGHATMATVYALHTQGIVKQDRLTIETNAGLLAIEITEQSSQLYIKMEQAQPVFKAFNGDREKLAQATGLTRLPCKQ
ncbi:PhzF family phenazine biosynthesis protein [Gracilibacillus alcaliphilus]|uniref:PhzF family phenazine biosynthesis protein n=1 Tax=Gracilibacillus alcaliphilus TaxID=1401441 RepID=UPI00195D2AFB|nr:PhzF family phenazine biosynthesis isomerase [Gracilibacillus alcaliphilus]MBM7679331.1 PhzF family phenazine biosynthesis protein [Gracilibacillus alcaliphilus]